MSIFISKLKKSIILGFLILMLPVATILSSCGEDNMNLEIAVKLIEQDNLGDLSLTVYYIDPLILIRAPLGVDDLLHFRDINKIVINGSNLKENIDLFKNMSKDDLIPVRNNSRLDARFYYVFETEKNRKLLDIAMWGDNNSIFVNGFEVEEDDIFYNVIIPFLPESAVKDLQAYLGYVRSGNLFEREGKTEGGA
jgi:hypothetical protein